MNFGIIADGNRRWAQKNQIPIKQGHKNGFFVIKDEILPVLEKEPNIDTCTIYVFSTENWKRPLGEVKNLMTLFSEIFDEYLAELLERQYKIIVPGRRDRIPAILLKQIKKAEKISKKNKKLNVYICLDYGGRDEIKRAAAKGEGKNLQQFLEVPDLDIVFRTGGERRLSNFCIWQAAYAEFFFVEKLLPEIKKEDIVEIICEFNNRNRRKGK